MDKFMTGKRRKYIDENAFIHINNKTVHITSY